MVRAGDKDLLSVLILKGIACKGYVVLAQAGVYLHV